MDRPASAASLLPGLPSGSRLLIVRLRSIGDIVLLTPTLRLLKEWRPDLQLSVLIESRFHELLEGNTDVDELIEVKEAAARGKFLARFRTLRELRRRRAALCVNLHGGPASAFFARFCGAAVKAGFAHFRSHRAYHVLIPDARTILAQPDIHTAEHQASAFFYLGLPRKKIPRAKLLVSPERKAWWQEKRAALGLGRDRDFALIHPTALYATKQWAPEKFAELGRWLEREANLAPVYSCGPGESPVLDAVERAAGSPLRRLEGASLGQFAAALADTGLFVGNDSGPAHMAAALGRPLVVIFGSSSSEIWGPWPRVSSGARARVVQNFYDCNPCPGDRCYRFDQPECILSVTAEQVQAAVKSMLAASEKQKAVGS